MGSQRKRKRLQKDCVDHRHSREKVCNYCGHRGFSELLVYCSHCFDLPRHRYCLSIVPGNKVYTEVVTWVCESCCLEDQPERCQMLPPKSFPAILEEEETEERSFHSQHPGETFIPMNDSYKELVLSSFVEHPETISDGSGEIATNEICKPDYSHSGEFVYKDEKTAESIEDIIQHPEAISDGVVLIASSSGEITIHESFKPEYSHACQLVYIDKENEERCSTEDTLVLPFGSEEHIDTEDTLVLDFGSEDTVVLDFGAEEKIDSAGCLSETVELDSGTDEANDVCSSGEPPAILDCVVADQVYQGIKASNIEGIEQVFSDYLPELLSLPVWKHSIEPGGLTENESQSSKPEDDFREMSIPASVLNMANELLDTSLERIDETVGPYKIKSDLAPILRNILSKYDDIFHDCVDAERDKFVVTVCQVTKFLHTVPFRSLRQQYVDYIRDILVFPDACGVDVGWLRNHCDFLEDVVHQTVQYRALKQEWTELKNDISDGKEGRLRELEGIMEKVKSFWGGFYDRTIAHGLF